MSFYLAVRFHKRPTTREIISVFLAFGGVYLSATQGNPSTMVLSPLGLTWGLMGAVAGVAYPVYLKAWPPTGVPSSPTVWA